jgi:hypothetical protein
LKTFGVTSSVNGSKKRSTNGGVTFALINREGSTAGVGDPNEEAVPTWGVCEEMGKACELTVMGGFEGEAACKGVVNPPPLAVKPMGAVVQTAVVISKAVVAGSVADDNEDAAGVRLELGGREDRKFGCRCAIGPPSQCVEPEEGVRQKAAEQFSIETITVDAKPPPGLRVEFTQLEDLGKPLELAGHATGGSV